MDEILIEKLIEFLENASPYVWEAAKRQVLVEVFQTIFWMIVMSIAATSLYKLAKKEYQKHLDGPKYNSHDMNAMLLGIGCFIAGAIALYAVSYSISVIANPDYYAIKMLADFITGN